MSDPTQRITEDELDLEVLENVSGGMNPSPAGGHISSTTGSAANPTGPTSLTANEGSTLGGTTTAPQISKG